ncbi:hypothetical protein [Lysinibacillus sp. LZ02]|uniref:hypothetical protein n=1 Tax=Lysinibacillus sp. LZ02 TaxID=3420668 RepID=UPI003D3683EB
MNKGPVFKVLWLMGLIILAYGTHQVLNDVEKQAHSAFNPTIIYWVKVTFDILIGCYLSIFFVHSKNVKLNKQLLYLISLPCLVLSLLFPIISSLSTIDVIAQWLNKSNIPFYELYFMNIFGIVGGLTFILSIFSGGSKKRK